jgi:protein SCO1/2
MNRWTRRAAALAYALALGAAAGAAPLPKDSIYQLDVTLQDQQGREHRLDSLQGQPRIVAMFYANCAYVCPLTIDTLRKLDEQLPRAQQARLGLLMVTIDPERDTVEALRATAVERHLDGAQWMLARTDAQGVRKLAAVLGIQYRRLDSGEFNHSTIFTLLDAQGRIRAQTSEIGEVDAEFLAAVKRLLDDAR